MTKPAPVITTRYDPKANQWVITTLLAAAARGRAQTNPSDKPAPKAS